MLEDPFKKYDPQILEVVRNFRLLDDDFMTKVFEDKACLELMLQIVMDIPTLKVKSFHIQDTLKNIQGRSVRFDVWAEDDAHTQYNIEVQRADKGAGTKRARYNSAMLDANITQPGDDCTDLPKTYVIFITENDILGKGQLCYRIERRYRVERTGQYEIFDDDAHILYVNAAYEDASTALGKLMADFRTRDPEQMHFQALKQRTKYFKEEPKGVGTMYRAVEDLVKKELSRTVENIVKNELNEAFLQLVQNMSKQKLSLVQMTALSERSEEEVIAALKKLGLSIPE